MSISLYLLDRLQDHPIHKGSGIRINIRKEKMAHLYLFAHMFDFICPSIKACSSSVRGTVHWVGLSSPVVALS